LHAYSALLHHAGVCYRGLTRLSCIAICGKWNGLAAYINKVLELCFQRAYKAIRQGGISKPLDNGWRNPHPGFRQPHAPYYSFMGNLHKRVEFASNLGIIVVALLLGGVLVNRYLLPASSTPETIEDPRIKPGTKLSLSGLDWEKGDKTLLMVLSTSCRFCTESAPFYQRLMQQKAGRADVRLVAVLPQSVGEAQQYLSTHGISVDEIRQAAPGAAYARATPTLIIVDRTGSVIESWVGKLPAEKEAEVLSRFLGERSSD
jgi:redoxin